LGNDLRLGKLNEPLLGTVATYPIFTVEDPADLVGRELYLFGIGDSAFSLPAQRLGRNAISEVTAGVTDQPAEQNSTYDFTFDVSVADVSGPDGVGDGKLDFYDFNLIAAGTLIDPMLMAPSYFDGDIFSGVFNGTSSLGIVDDGDVQEFLDEVVRTGGDTGGFGWAEALMQGGDSGNPSFTLVEGKPSLIGTHWRKTQDTYVGFDPAEIINLVDFHSGGTERPCFVSFTRNYVLGGSTFELPTEHLQQQRLGQRLFGDVNGDFILTVDDIRAMEQEIKAHANSPTRACNWGFDLNDDQQIDADDLKTMMELGFKTSVADFVDSSLPSGDDRVPDGNVQVLAEGFAQVANLDTAVDSYFDGDLNVDGVVDVLSDAFILVSQLEAKGLLRINPDYNADGVLDADDIDLLTALLHPWRAPQNLVHVL
jgi:hypothetical protein